jgi:hypothetical protein
VRNVRRYDDPGFRAKADAEGVAEIAKKIDGLQQTYLTVFDLSFSGFTAS